MTKHLIDIRSDTVTRPTPEMLESMMQAEVGDDVYGEDPAVNALQNQAAKMFGMEAALFCPSGTMTNQIGIRVHTRPGDEVICSELAHVYQFEGGGIASNSGASVRLLSGNLGRFTAELVTKSVNQREDPHYPWSRLVVIENTVNMGGGACWDLQEISRIREACDNLGLALHLDGARLFNALIARGESPKAYGHLFDTISICLSKGLGAPVGSLLLGSGEAIRQAHRIRKAMGGGMRQAGYLAAAGSYALDNHIERLREDHSRAKLTADFLRELPYVEEILPVETNIVIFKLPTTEVADGLVNFLNENQIRVGKVGDDAIRFVFHLEIGDNDLDRLHGVLRSYRKTV